MSKIKIGFSLLDVPKQVEALALNTRCHDG